jgi:penicillin-binding protein 1C
VVKHRKTFAIVLGVFFAAIALGIAALWYWSSGRELRIPSPAQVRKEYRLSEGYLLDRHGALLQQIRLSFNGRRAEWVKLEDMSPALLAAVIQSEDQRFYSHRGIDWRGVFAAAVQGLRSGNWRGASTISMQVLSFLFPESIPRHAKRTVRQKIRQMLVAGRLEKQWSKKEILESYVNLVPFRGELEGISAASLGLFGKNPHGINPAEASILAALIRSPNASVEQVARRAAGLAVKLGWNLSEPELQKTCQDSFKSSYRLPQEYNWAPHVARILFAPALNCLSNQDTHRFQNQDTHHSAIKSVDTHMIRCSLDGYLQRLVTELLRQHLIELRPRNVGDGAVLVTDNATGEVLAYVGSGGDLSSATQVDGVQALRQAGSTLKPFIYGTAIDSRLLTAASLLKDEPLEIPQAGGIYKPDNYDHRFRGIVTVRMALASSMNIPAVRTLQLITVESFWDKLRAMEFRNLNRADYYGPSLALGTVDVSLWDLTNAYRMLAVGGTWTPLRLSMDTHQSSNVRQILGAPATYIIGDILSDRESRGYAFGLSSPLSTPFWTAVKTGTSKDMRDNWCIGYSQRYTVGVWMGNFNGEPMWNVLGVTGAAPLWSQIMSLLHRNLPSNPPLVPRGVLRQAIEIPNLGINLQEYFLAQTETDVIEKRSNPAKARIISPVGGEIIAWDPDIPAENQRLFFEAQPQSSELTWELDGKRIGTAEVLLFWTPLPGSHTLTLWSESEEMVDSIKFLVKGNTSP